MQSLPGLPLACMPIRASDVCRLANLNKTAGDGDGSSAIGVMAAVGSTHRHRSAAASAAVPAAGAATFMIHEDTQFLPGGGPSVAAVYEDDDTDMLAGALMMPSGAGGGPLLHGSNLAIYEDTQFLPGMAGIGQVQQQQQGGPAGLTARPPERSAGPSSAGMIHVDTDFITRDIVWGKTG